MTSHSRYSRDASVSAIRGRVRRTIKRASTQKSLNSIHGCKSFTEKYTRAAREDLRYIVKLKPPCPPTMKPNRNYHPGVIRSTWKRGSSLYAWVWGSAWKDSGTRPCGHTCHHEHSNVPIRPKKSQRGIRINEAQYQIKKGKIGAAVSK